MVWRFLLFTAVLLTLSQRLLKSPASNTCPCCGNPKYLARLDKLKNSTKTALQSLRIVEHEGLSSPKQLGRKKHKLKWRSEDCDCAENLFLGIDVKMNLLKCTLANDKQRTVILHNYVIMRSTACSLYRKSEQ